MAEAVSGKKMEGKIFSYFEQGYEGPPWAFQDGEFIVPNETYFVCTKCGVYWDKGGSKTIEDLHSFYRKLHDDLLGKLRNVVNAINEIIHPQNNIREECASEDESSQIERLKAFQIFLETGPIEKHIEFKNLRDQRRRLELLVSQSERELAGLCQPENHQWQKTTECLWDYAGLYIVEPGDKLTVFDDDGKVTFEGVIEIGGISDGPMPIWYPKGISKKNWRKLFSKDRKAMLERVAPEEFVSAVSRAMPGYWLRKITRAETERMSFREGETTVVYHQVEVIWCFKNLRKKPVVLDFIFDPDWKRYAIRVVDRA